MPTEDIFAKHKNFIQLVLAVLPIVLRDKSEKVALEQATRIVQLCRQLDPNALPKSNRLEKAAKDFCFYATGKSKNSPSWLDLKWWEAARRG